jgi:lambda repressor-like predicted transcriptional regulator
MDYDVAQIKMLLSRSGSSLAKIAREQRVTRAALSNAIADRHRSARLIEAIEDVIGPLPKLPENKNV